MKLLHVVATRELRYGGPVRVAESMARYIRDRGCDARVFPDGPVRGFLYWPGPSEVARLWNQIAWSDIVHVHGLWTAPTTLAAVCARCQGRHYVVTPHGMLDSWSLRRSARKKMMYAALFERRNLDAATALHVLNNEELQEARSFGVRSPAFILANGVVEEDIQDNRDRALLEARFPWLQGKIVVLFLGRIHPKKGLDLLIPALQQVLSSCPSLYLILAGPDDGGYRRALEEMIGRATVGDHVIFTGEVLNDDKRVLLAGSDLFVLPSRQEGDSVAVKEAMASGLPVIVTRACHLPEVASGRAGFVIDRNVESVGHALLTLGQDPELRRELGARARELVRRRYCWNMLADRLVAVYRDLMLGTRESECWVPGERVSLGHR